MRALLECAVYASPTKTDYFTQWPLNRFLPNILHTLHSLHYQHQAYMSSGSMLQVLRWNKARSCHFSKNCTKDAKCANVTCHKSDTDNDSHDEWLDAKILYLELAPPCSPVASAVGA